MTEQTSWKSKPSESKKFSQTAMMASSRSKGLIEVPESVLQKNEERKKQLVADKIQIFESTTKTSPTTQRRFSDAKLSTTSPANISQMINKFQQSPSPPLEDQKRASFSHFKTNSITKNTNNNNNQNNNSNSLSNSTSKISVTHARSSTISSPSSNRITSNSLTNSSGSDSNNNSLNNSNSSLSNSSLNNSGNKSNSSSPSNSLKVDKNETIIRNIIIQLEKDFTWFSKGWEDEIESKKEEEIKTLISIITNFNAPSNEKTPTDAYTEKMNAISPYLHMSVKEKWARTDSNLSVSMEKDRLIKITSLVKPFQEQITEFISSAYKSVNIQVNFDGNIVGTENTTIDASKIILLITQKIELLTEEGNSSVKLINDLRKVILDKISSTLFIGVAKEHILSAANLSYNPKYVNNLVLVRLNTLLDRLRSLTVQIANAISALDVETGLVDHRSILENLSCFRLITGNIKKVVDQLATSQALSELLRKKMSDFDENNKKKKKSYKRKKAGTSHTNPDNIYNFNKDQPKNENWEDGAGTLNSLVLRLTSTEQIDQMYMKSFTTTYLSFTTSENLLNKIMERYHVPSTISQEEKIQIQLRVCIVIKYWIDTKMKDFEDDLILKLVDFIDFQLKNDGHIDAAKMLRSTLDKSISKVNEETVVNHPKIEIFEVRWSPTDMLLNASEKDIAEQITLISWRNYKNIDVNELLNLSWAKKQTRHRSPNIIACIKRFNHVSFWVATMILFHEKLKDRSKVITKFIGIAQELRKLNNFDGIMYIIAGLRSSAIDRLQFSKFSVNESLLTAFDEIANIMSPQASWKTYREVLRSSALPAIPFIGIYLTDLTFIEDGNPDRYRDGELINFNKRQMVYKVLQEIIVFQSVGYQIEPKEPILSYLTQMPYLKEEELYNLSIQREPRGCTIKDLL